MLVRRKGSKFSCWMSVDSVLVQTPLPIVAHASFEPGLGRPDGYMKKSECGGVFKDCGGLGVEPSVREDLAVTTACQRNKATIHNC